jgi:aryl-alcohol dehydrogenase-like predicted oxidoreductase
VETREAVRLMRVRSFGRTGLTVSELGMGCSALGGGVYQHDRREALATLRAAHEAGITFYDTADNYSLGEAFRGLRSRVVIATKGGAAFSPLGRVGLRIKPLLRPVKSLLWPARRALNHLRDAHKRYEHSAAHLTAALEASLRRLRTDHVDLYQLYNPSSETLRRSEVFRALEAFTRSGKARCAGVSCVTAEDALLCCDAPAVSSVQVTINLLDREAIQRLLPRAAERGVAVIARVPLAQGLLTDAASGTMAEQAARDEEEFQRRRRCAEQFRFLARPGRSLAQAALQFVLRLEGVSVVIPGMVTRAQLAENLGALRAPALSAEELTRIEGSAAWRSCRDPASSGG